MIRAYRDPALRYPLGRSGTWRSALEVPVARGEAREKRVYVHNPSGATYLVKPEVVGATPGFIVELPASVRLSPGVTSFTVRITASGAVPLPSVADFVIRTVGDTSSGQAGSSAHTTDAHLDVDYTMESAGSGEVSLRVEVSAFALPSADERFGDLGTSPLRSVTDFTTYLASGMGFVDEAYRSRMVQFMADHTYDLALWGLNKHYRLDPRYGPMRLAHVRPNSIGYDPPGVPGLPPPIRRRVYARSFQLARDTGSAAGIKGIFQAIGVPQPEIAVWREGFTWFVRVPQWVAGAYSLDLLGQLALYHVDAYCLVNLGINEDTQAGVYSNLDYTVDPPLALSSGVLLIEDGVSYLLLESGDRIKLEA